MNKWQLLNALEEARTDNTKHTETISKLTTHIQGLWDEIEQKQFKINNLNEKNDELLEQWKLYQDNPKSFWSSQPKKVQDFRRKIFSQYRTKNI